MTLRFISVFILCILLSGCGKPSGGNPEEFTAYLERMDAQRRENLLWSSEDKLKISDYTPDFQDQLGVFSEEELDFLMTKRDTADISEEEAKEDVTTFFKLLQTTYGGYIYFGGDNTFLPVQTSVLSELEGKGKVSAEELQLLLTDFLKDKIVDGHLMIGDYYFTLESDNFMYYVPDLYLDQIEIESEYIKPTIGPDGRLTHCFAAVSHDGTELPAEIEISGKRYRLQWKQTEAYTPDSDQVGYRKTIASGIPVLESRILYDKNGNEEVQTQLNALAKAGKEYKDFPVFIVDLRHNGGGDSGYARRWVEGFTGRQVQSKVAYLEKCSEPFLRQIENNPAYAMVDPGWKEIYLSNKGGWNKGTQDGIFLENTSVIFLLMDKETGSSGEDFVRYLSTAGHVVRVGTNTAGVLQFGNVCEFYLPHSGLFLRIGSKTAFYDSMELSEGIGVLPDLWVNAPDALNAAVQMCEYYRLNNGEESKK